MSEPEPEQVVEPPLLPDTTGDESGEGWGDAPDDDRHYFEERPPHHGD